MTFKVLSSTTITLDEKMTVNCLMELRVAKGVCKVHNIFTGSLLKLNERGFFLVKDIDKLKYNTNLCLI